MKTTIGKKIHDRRTALGISAIELAKRVGVSRGFIYLLEQGGSGISPERLCAFARALGINVKELDPSTKQADHKPPAWLDYLMNEYSLEDEDCRELLKVVDKWAIPDRFPDESDEEFKRRWQEFYFQMIQFLTNASVKVLAHPEMRNVFRTLGWKEHVTSWRQVYDWFDRLISEKMPSAKQEFTDGASWKTAVGECLKIGNAEDARKEDWDGLLVAQTSALAAQIENSPRFYASIVRDASTNKYWHVHKNEGNLFDRRDASWWHEAVRALIDPTLALKSGSIYYPDGEVCPPVEMFLSRLSSWLAVYPFRDRFVRKVKKVTPTAVESFSSLIYGDKLPWRTAFMGFLDALDQPYMYVDSYKRMKRNELKAANLNMEDVAKVTSHKDAKLRVGFFFRNFSAEDSKWELRANLRIPDSSSIAKVFASKSSEEIESEEDFSLWDPNYDLSGRMKTISYYQEGVHGEGHVRTIIRQQS